MVNLSMVTNFAVRADDRTALWNDVTQALSHQYFSKALTDLTFYCNAGAEIYAHQGVMGRMSNVLEKMFRERRSHMCCDNQNRVSVSLPYSMQAVKNMLELVYLGLARVDGEASRKETLELMRCLEIEIPFEERRAKIVPRGESVDIDSDSSIIILSDHEPTIVTTPTTSSASPTVFRCDVCSKTFKYNIELKRHRKVCSPANSNRTITVSSNSLVVSECEMVVNSPGVISLNDCRSDKNAPPNKRDPPAHFFCRFCPATYPKQAEKYFRIHEEECSKKAATSSTLGSSASSSASTTTSSVEAAFTPPFSAAIVRDTRSKNAHLCKICHNSFSTLRELTNHFNVCGAVTDEDHAPRSKSNERTQGNCVESRVSSANGNVANTEGLKCGICDVEIVPNDLEGYLTHLHGHYYTEMKKRYEEQTDYKCSESGCNFIAHTESDYLKHRGISHQELANFVDNKVKAELTKLGYKNKKRPLQNSLTSSILRQDNTSKKSKTTVQSATPTMTKTAQSVTRTTLTGTDTVIPCRKCHELIDSSLIKSHSETCEKHLDLNLMDIYDTEAE